MIFLQRCFRKGSQYNRKKYSNSFCLISFQKKLDFVFSKKILHSTKKKNILPWIIVIVATFKIWKDSKIRCSFSKKVEVVFCLRKQQIQTKVLWTLQNWNLLEKWFFWKNSTSFCFSHLMIRWPSSQKEASSVMTTECCWFCLTILMTLSTNFLLKNTEIFTHFGGSPTTLAAES